MLVTKEQLSIYNAILYALDNKEVAAHSTTTN